MATFKLPPAPVPLGVENWKQRLVFNTVNIRDFFFSCGVNPDHTQYNYFIQLSALDNEAFFNPNSSFGRAFLKLPFNTRFAYIIDNLCENTLFLMTHTQPRISPILKPKPKPKQKHIPTPIVLSFIPPLYILKIPPPSEHFPPHYYFSPLSPSHHHLNPFLLSFEPVREGIGWRLSTGQAVQVKYSTRLLDMSVVLLAST